MEAKNKIGGLLVIVGIGALGYYMLNKSKPTVSKEQQAKLQAELNPILAYGGKDDITVKIANPTVQAIAVDYELFPPTMTKTEIANLGKAVNDVCPSCQYLDNTKNIENSISQNMKGADFSNFDIMKGLKFPTV